jgi:hypothetical protein
MTGGGYGGIQSWGCGSVRWRWLVVQRAASTRSWHLRVQTGGWNIDLVQWKGGRVFGGSVDPQIRDSNHQVHNDTTIVRSVYS